ncbi:MAG: hypothetical protein WD066_02775 [Planctomycetaceae bacterium]
MNATRTILLSAFVCGVWSAPADAQIRVQIGPRRGYQQPAHAHQQPGVIYQQPGHVHQQPVPQYTYQFGDRRHLDRLATQLEREANDLCWEMYRNYQRNPGWRDTYREAYQVLQDAKHIHELVHDQYRGARNEDHIADDLHEMDKLFHHIEGDVARWQPDRAGRFHIDPHDPHGGHMHHHGDLPRKLKVFEDTLHHMMTDYGVRTRLGDPPAPGGPGSGDAPPPSP